MVDRNELQELVYDLHVVSGARFAMASRLNFSANAKGFLINGVTAISIFISAGLLIADADKLSIETVAFALVGISIFIMWMNLDKSENELREQAKNAQKCGVAINEIKKGLQHNSLSKDQALKEYEQALLGYEINHNAFDRGYSIYLLKTKYGKAAGATWLRSVLPWILLCLWYPAVFVVWAITVYVVSRQII